MTSIPGTYEFSEEQNQIIKSLALYMKVLAIVLLVVGGLMVLASVALVASIGTPAIVLLVEGGLILTFGIFTQRAASAFRQIVASAGADVGHLMSALVSLRGLYRLQVILLIAGVGLAGLAIVVAGAMAVR